MKKYNSYQNSLPELTEVIENTIAAKQKSSFVEHKPFL